MKKGLHIPIWFGLITGLVFAILFGWFEFQAIERATAVGAHYIFLLISSLVVALVTGSLAFLFAFGFHVLRGKERYRYLIGFSLILLPLVLAAYGVWYIQLGFKAEEMIQKISHMKASALSHRYHLLIGKNKSPFYAFEIAAIVQNPHASGALLNEVAQNEDRAFSSRLASPFDLNGQNIKGISIRRLITRNPNVQKETLIYLMHNTNNDYLLGDIASHPKTPVSILRALSKRDGYAVEWGLASNPKTPPDMLIKLAEGKKDDFGTQYTRLRLASNPSTPLTLLKQLAKDQDASISQAAKDELKKRLSR